MGRGSGGKKNLVINNLLVQLRVLSFFWVFLFVLHFFKANLMKSNRETFQPLATTPDLPIGRQLAASSR